MSSDVVALKLLNRTKYAQNRTKYYTVRNTVLSQTQRPFFVTGSYYDPANNRKLISLKKSFLNRRSSRRGPFQKLSLPHEYYKSLGDPLYYSHSELVSSCLSASSENMGDAYFWKQICEKIREVRDLMNIHDLLKCVSSIVKVNYYDRDLFRVLSREFVDDMRKLSLEDISQLLYCYYRQNVYSCDLVNSAGSRVATTLIKELDTSFNDTSETETRGVLGKIKDIIPKNKSVETDFRFRPLSRILKYCHYFNYSNPEFYFSIANTFIKFSTNMDFLSRMEIFTYLDPKLMITESGTCSDGSSGVDGSVSSDPDVSKDIVSQVLDSMDSSDGSDLYHENSFEIGVFLSSQLFRDAERAKLVHDIASVSSSCNLISKAIVRYVSSCTHLGSGWRDSLCSLISLLSRCSGELLPMLSRLSVFTQGSLGMSPFVSSLENLAMDSLLTGIHALNSSWRLKLGCVDVSNCEKLCKLLKFNLEDDNIHSRLLKQVGMLNLSGSEVDILSSVAGSINSYGCKGQSVRNLTSCFESLSALLNNNNGPTSLPLKLLEDISRANESVSLEIVRQLVDFDRESLYRVSLSLSSTESKNVHLEHYVNYFPKITRRRHEMHHITISNPFNDLD